MGKTTRRSKRLKYAASAAVVRVTRAGASASTGRSAPTCTMLSSLRVTRLVRPGQRPLGRSDRHPGFHGQWQIAAGAIEVSAQRALAEQLDEQPRFMR